MNGILDRFGILSYEKFKSQVIEDLNSQSDFFGISFPFFKSENQEQAIQEAKDFEILWSKKNFNCLDAIDTGIPPAKITGIIDPTSLIGIEPFLEILTYSGKKPEWVIENSKSLMSINPIALSNFSKCENKMLEEELLKIDKTLSAEKIRSVLDRTCSIGQEEVKKEISLKINQTDSEIKIIDLYPEKNDDIIESCLSIFKNFFLLSKMGLELVEKINEGIESFVLYCIDFLIAGMDLVIEKIINEKYGAILYYSIFKVILRNVIFSLIVALVGFLIGEGLIAYSVAIFLGVV